MKLNQSQINVLKCVADSKKATYAQAVDRGGNGKTVEALVKKGVLVANAPAGKVKVTTFSLTAEGKVALKAANKAAKATA